MVGYVVDCTERYAIALSVLSNSFRTSGKLSGTDYAGLIYWDGTDPHIVLMSDSSKYAEPKPGQEVETTTGSLFFPDGIKIGRIIEAHLNETGTTYTARVELTAHFRDYRTSFWSKTATSTKYRTCKRAKTSNNTSAPDPCIVRFLISCFSC